MVRDTSQRISCFDRRQLIITWMSNMKNVRRKPELGISWSVAAMLCDVVVVVAASHIDYEKRVAWVFVPLHACGSVPIVMVRRLAAHWAPELCYKSLLTGRRPWRCRLHCLRSLCSLLLPVLRSVIDIR